MVRISPTIEEALAVVADGCTLAVPRETAGVAMAATRALIRRGVRGLTLITVPTSSLQADMLIGAGCVDILETAGISLGEYGPAPRFVAAVLAGEISLKDTTCPAVYAGLQAAEKGVPFMPLRGLIGTDVLAQRGDWRIIDNPFGTADPIVLLPALQPEVAVFHAPLADRFGNIWIGRERELMMMAHAARSSVVTVEAFWDGNLLDDPLRAPATVPGELYVEAVALAPRGAWPLGLPGHYRVDAAHLRDYARLAATPAGFARYLSRDGQEGPPAVAAAGTSG
jgi:glutaconate CoA-transferase, subunit A